MSSDAFKTWLEIIKQGVVFPLDNKIKSNWEGTSAPNVSTRPSYQSQSNYSAPSQNHWQPPKSPITQQDPTKWYNTDSNHGMGVTPNYTPFNGNPKLREEPRDPWPNQFKSPRQPNEYGEYYDNLEDSKTDRPFYPDIRTVGGGK